MNKDWKIIVWAVVPKKKMKFMGLPIIYEEKPTKYDKRFCKCVRVEIREIRF
jgi:hypothetical protein